VEKLFLKRFSKKIPTHIPSVLSPDRAFFFSKKEAKNRRWIFVASLWVGA